jgi:predicted nucleic acid-binding protein
MNRAFLDTSVLVQFFIGEPGDLTERAVSLLDHLTERDEVLRISATVIFETVYVLHGTYGVPRALVTNKLVRFVGLPGIALEEADVIIEALNFWVARSPLSFGDCYHLALAKSLGLSKIYSFDKKMNRYPGVERVEP